ncbi:Condensin complex subunit 3 [Dictyocoela muelleri]|nr:Condensin complex subunit 3 [Dictyocoela muelleri]
MSLVNIFENIQNEKRIPQLKKASSNEIIEIISILICNGKKISPLIIKSLQILVKKIDMCEMQLIKDYFMIKIDTKKNVARRIVVKLIKYLFEEDDLQDFFPKFCEKLFDRDIGVRKEAIRFLRSRQDCQINEKVSVLAVFKELLRYDKNPSVRKEVLKVINLNKKTYSAVISRCRDKNKKVRDFFYNQVLQNINLREISVEDKRIILKSSFFEREINVKDLFLEQIKKQYQFPEDISIFMSDFYDENVEEKVIPFFETIYESLNSEFHIFKECIPLGIAQRLSVVDSRVSIGNSAMSYSIGDVTPSSIFLIKSFLNFAEKKYGRDSLKLMPLDDFCMLLYQKVKIDIDSGEISANSSLYKNMFGILNFYDIFTEDVKKIILGVIYKLLISGCSNPSVIEECVIFAKKTFKNFINADDDEIKFLGATIGKIMKLESSLKISIRDHLLLLSKYVMKHIHPISEIHRAIMREIISDFKNPYELDILFFYLLNIKYLDPEEYNNYIEALFENFRFHDRVDLLIDLWFSFEDDHGKIEDVLIVFLKDKDKILNNSLFSICKLLLFKPITGVLKHVFAEYYFGDDENLRQFLVVFLHEFSKNNLQLIIDEFEQIFNFITQLANDKADDTNKIQKIFTNQVLNKIYDNKGSLKDFLLKISIFLMRQWNDNLGNLVMGADRNCWDVSFIKKIIFCFSKITKKVENKRVKEFLLELIATDDGEPIDQVDLEDLRNRLENNL